MYHFCLYRVYVAVARLSLVAVSESCPSLWCESFPLQRSPLLQKTGSGAQGLSSSSLVGWSLWGHKELDMTE